MRIASVERVLSISPHPNADKLEIVTILGWRVVCKKGEFRTGDLVVYVNIDTVLEPHPCFAFLEKCSYRIKPVRLRGEISQGICFPLTLLDSFQYDTESPILEGSDVSSIIRASHYEKPVPVQLDGEVRGHFPSFLIKTDEDNLRNHPEAMAEIASMPCYITQKMDGTSCTMFLNEGRFGVCSRNWELIEGDNVFWQMAKKHRIREKLFGLGRNLAIQGEIYGPGVQSNPSGASSIELAIFNAYDIDSRSYFGMEELVAFVAEIGVPMVRILQLLNEPPSLEQLVRMAKECRYDNGRPAEGIVVRTKVPVKSAALGRNRWSAKVLNESYDL